MTTDLSDHYIKEKNYNDIQKNKIIMKKINKENEIFFFFYKDYKKKFYYGKLLRFFIVFFKNFTQIRTFFLMDPKSCEKKI